MHRALTGETACPTKAKRESAEALSRFFPDKVATSCEVSVQDEKPRHHHRRLGARHRLDLCVPELPAPPDGRRPPEFPRVGIRHCRLRELCVTA